MSIPVPPIEQHPPAAGPPFDATGNTLLLYADIYDPINRVVLATTRVVFDWHITYDVDATGLLSASFMLGDYGNGTNPFSSTLIAAAGGADSSSTTPARYILRLSLGGTTTGGNACDFYDSQKVIQNPQRSIKFARPVIMESGNDIWEEYNKLIIPRYSAENITFNDLMQGTFGQITPVTVAQKGIDFITNDGKLTGLGGLFNMFRPFGESAISIGLRRASFEVNVDPSVKNEVISVDIFNDGFGHALLLICQKLAGTTGVPAHGHFLADASTANAVARQTVYIGTITPSGLTFTGTFSDGHYSATPPATSGGGSVYIEGGLLVSPQGQEVFNTIQLRGGQTTANLPAGSKINALKMINRGHTSANDAAWGDNLPLIGLKVTDVVGGVYLSTGHQELVRISPSFGVNDMAIDQDGPNSNNLIYAAMARGVYSTDCDVVSKIDTRTNINWNKVGGLDGMVIKLQLSPQGGRLYALIQGTGRGKDGLYRTQDPTAFITTGSSGITDSLAADYASHSGWDRVHISQSNINDFEVAADNAIYWLDSNSPNLLFGSGLDPNSVPPSRYYPSPTAYSITKLNRAANGIYAILSGGPTTVYLKKTDVLDTTWYPIDFTGGTYLTTGQQPQVNSVVTIRNYLNDVYVNVVVCTSNGLYWCGGDPTVPGNWRSANGQNGFDAVDLLFFISAPQYTPTGQPSLSTCYAANANTFYESRNGAKQWTEVTNDTVDMSCAFFHSFYDRYGNFPSPSDNSLQLASDVVNSTVGLVPIDMTKFYIYRRRDFRGMWVYYLTNDTGFIQGGDPTLPMYISTVGALGTSLVIDSLLASQQLTLVCKKWLFEHVQLYSGVILESGFTQVTDPLRTLRPLQTANVTYVGNMTTNDGTVQYVNFVNKSFYVLTHEIYSGGDTDARARTSTTLSTQMAKQRLTVDELAADLIHDINQLHVLH